MKNKNYNEFKYFVSNDNLLHIKHLFANFLGGSDPFPEGVVDSIYYDTFDGYCLEQCEDGDAAKVKYRIRGYGNNEFNQIHKKSKKMSVVSKIKSPIEPVQCDMSVAPNWDQLQAASESTAGFDNIQASARLLGSLIPVIRVRYFRYRFRAYDYRITLDTQIEVSSFINGWNLPISYAVLPAHVLEIKTFDARPYLPFMGIAKLPQVSFSKFMMGLQLLQTGSL